MKAICASVNFDRFIVLPRPTAPNRCAAKLEFSSNPRSNNREAGHVDKILRGTKAADLPVEAPTELEFVINLKTAQALGLSVSPQLQIAANELIQ